MAEVQLVGCAEEKPLPIQVRFGLSKWCQGKYLNILGYVPLRLKLVLVVSQFRLYPKSFEPKRGSTASADFSILSAIAYNHPEANTLRDLGVTESSSSI